MYRRGFSFRSNLMGFIQPHFLIGTGMCLLASLCLSFKVDGYHFCEAEPESGSHCVPCPEHATCSQTSVVSCDHQLLNDGYQCLFTTLDESGLAALHKQIINEYSKNTTRTAEEIYSLFSEAVFPSDFNSALAYRGRYQKTADGRIAHTIFSFVRTRSPFLSIRAFTMAVAVLYGFSVTGAIASHIF
jgi:hypothetical protein